jgi:hypothetical protein
LIDNPRQFSGAALAAVVTVFLLDVARVVFG